MFQHTAARRRLGFDHKQDLVLTLVSTHSRPKAAGLSTNRQPGQSHPFQHTAARRRLDGHHFPKRQIFTVSTHSRPKAAGLTGGTPAVTPTGFNTQPPEGGWQQM